MRHKNVVCWFFKLVELEFMVASFLFDINHIFKVPYYRKTVRN